MQSPTISLESLEIAFEEAVTLPPGVRPDPKRTTSRCEARMKTLKSITAENEKLTLKPNILGRR